LSTKSVPLVIVCAPFDVDASRNVLITPLVGVRFAGHFRGFRVEAGTDGQARSVQFVVVMRDGGRYAVDAEYLEVVAAPVSTVTFLGPVPGYERAILAAFPSDVVAAVLPVAELVNFVPADAGPTPGLVAPGAGYGPLDDDLDDDLDEVPNDQVGDVDNVA
jgi:hypothetical protein